MEFQSYHYFLTTLLVCFSLDLLMFMFLLVTCNEHHNDENDNEGDGPHLWMIIQKGMSLEFETEQWW